MSTPPLSLDPNTVSSSIIASTPPPKRGIFGQIGQFLHDNAGNIQQIGAQLAQAGGNSAPMQSLLARRQQDLQSQQMASNQATADLQRQLLQKNIENYRTPEQQDQDKYNLWQKEQEYARANPALTDITSPVDPNNPGAGALHYNRNPYTGEVTPTMVAKTVPNPTVAPTMPPVPPAGNQGPMPPSPIQPNAAGMTPSAIGNVLTPSPTAQQQTQLTAMPPTAMLGFNYGPAGIVTDPNSPLYGQYGQAQRDKFGRPIGYVPTATQPAGMPTETSTTQTQTGPNGVNQVNQTTTLKKPAISPASGGGNSTDSAKGGSPLARPTSAPSAANPSNMNYKMTGAEAAKLQDQDVALTATRDLAQKVLSQAPLFASMIDGGKIQLAADPNSGFMGKILSRNLSPEEAQLAGNVQSLMEHINTMRLALSAQGFRGEEAWNALQAQRGNLTQNPRQIQTTLGNTIAVVNGLLANHQQLLNPPSKKSNAPQTMPSTSGGFQHF